MKRPPGLWVLLSAGVLLLLLQNVHARKATELIFGKTTTTTTTTTTPATIQGTENGENKDGSLVANSEESENAIKSNLTGVPQVDYIFDPNLPRELNGYNLSSYPFYSSMPEDINFKCDGLHDGFYAGVAHKCQVYHHCLSGTRYDFLCANYTAFDQKTFICHFVSEVDCNNSHKYWHRNDALYQATTTTTTTTTTAKPPPAVVISTATNRRPPPAGRRPRPSRRRPQYDYYDEEYEDDVRDDYYEEPPSRRRRKRPRPQRRRPVYEDDYEEYEDDRYDRRGSGRRNGDGDDRKSSDGDGDRKHAEREYDDGERRKPDDRRNKEDINKRPHEDRFDREKDRKSHDDRRYDDRRKDDRRRDYEDRYRHDKYDDDDDDYRHDRDRKKEIDHKRRPLDEDADYKNDRNKRPSNDRRYENRRPSTDRNSYERPRKAHRRPYDDDDDRRSYNNRHRPNDDRDDLVHSQDNKRPASNNQGLVKPNSGSSVFNQPRMPPKIRPPVPRNEQNKFPIKTVTEKQPSKVPEDDFYEYEDEPLPKQSTPLPTRRPQHQESSTKRLADETRENRRPSGLGSKPRTQTSRKPAIIREPQTDDYPEEVPRYNPKQESTIRNVKPNLQNRNRPLLEDALIVSNNREFSATVKPLAVKERNTSSNTPKFSPKEPRIKPTTEIVLPSTTAATTKEPPRERQEPVIKVVKRPFLPSRGGNPLSARGLQPVGAKALDPTRNAPLQESPDYIDDEALISDTFGEQRHNYKLSSSTVRGSATAQNARQFPTLTENKASPFLINEQPSSQSYQPDVSYEPPPLVRMTQANAAHETKPFKPSPVLIKVPVRVKYADNEEFLRPVSNRPFRPNNKPREYEESRPTEKGAVGQRNPLDINETEYDVTLNDALNPTIPNLPIRNFPTSFASDSDYTYNSYQRPRYDVSLNQAPEGRYQVRAPSQRVETVQPYISGDGKKYIDLSPTTNFRSSPQITQAYYTF